MDAREVFKLFPSYPQAVSSCLVSSKLLLFIQGQHTHIIVIALTSNIEQTGIGLSWMILVPKIGGTSNASQLTSVVLGLVARQVLPLVGQ